jgi:hypothetical protein
MVEVGLLFAMLVLGHAIHILKKVVERRSDGDNIGMVAYVRERPYRIVLGGCGSVVAFAMLHSTGELGVLTALGAGYIADSGMGMLDSYTKRKA